MSKSATNSRLVSYIEFFLVCFLLFVNLESLLYINDTIFSQEHAYFIVMTGSIGLIVGYNILNSRFFRSFITPRSSIYFSASIFMVSLISIHVLDLSVKINELLYIALLFIAFALLIFKLYSSLKEKGSSLNDLLVIFFCAAAVFYAVNAVLLDAVSGPVWLMVIVNTAIVLLFWFIDRQTSIFIQPVIYLVMVGLLFTLTGQALNSYVKWGTLNDRVKVLTSLNNTLNVSDPVWDSESRSDLISIKLGTGSTSQWLFRDGDSYGPIGDDATDPNISLVNYPLAIYPSLYKELESALVIDLPILDKVLKQKNVSSTGFSAEDIPSLVGKEKKYDLIAVNLSLPTRQEGVHNFVNSSSNITDENISVLFDRLSDGGKISFVTNNQAYIVKTILLLKNACAVQESCESIGNGITVLQLKSNLVSTGNPYIYLLVFDKYQEEYSINNLMDNVNTSVVDVIFSTSQFKKSFYNGLLEVEDPEIAARWLSQNVFKPVKRVNVDIAMKAKPDFYLLNKIPGITLTLPLAMLVLYLVIQLIFIPLKRDDKPGWAPLPLIKVFFIISGFMASLAIVHVTGLLDMSLSISSYSESLYYIGVAIVLYFAAKLPLLVINVITLLCVVLVAVMSDMKTDGVMAIVTMMMLAAVVGYNLSSDDKFTDVLTKNLKLNLIIAGFLLGLVVSQYLFKTANIQLLQYFLLASIVYLFGFTILNGKLSTRV